MRRRRRSEMPVVIHDSASGHRAPNHRGRATDDPNDARAIRHYRDATSDARATDGTHSAERTNYSRSSDDRTKAQSRNTSGIRSRTRVISTNFRGSNPEGEH